MLTGRKSVGQDEALSVCIERRIVRIVREVASSVGEGVVVGARWGGSRVDGLRTSPQKGRCRLRGLVSVNASLSPSRLLHMIYSTRNLLLPTLFENLLLFLHFRFELDQNPRIDEPMAGELFC